jgi:hypothetical protein
MYEIETFTGRIIELRHCLNRPPRFTEHDPAGQRWDTWLEATNGDEQQFSIPCSLMPARAGHAVHLLLISGTPVGLYNLDTGKRVNFARIDPALLLRGVDKLMWCFAGMVGVGAIVGGCLEALKVATVVPPLYYSLMVAARHARKRSLQRRVDQVLDEIQADHVVRPFRRSR